MLYDVEPIELIEKTAEELKKIEAIKPPIWASFVKTGMHKERPPARDDWWYIRAAAILRAVRKSGPVGVQKLRTKYGGKKGRGHKPEHFYRGSGNIIRKILQQLEKAELIKKGEKGVHKGRVVTPKGISMLDKVADSIAKAKPKEEKQKEEKPKVEEKKPIESPVKVKEVKEKKADKKEASEKKVVHKPKKEP